MMSEARPIYGSCSTSTAIDLASRKPIDVVADLRLSSAGELADRGVEIDSGDGEGADHRLYRPDGLAGCGILDDAVDAVDEESVTDVDATAGADVHDDIGSRRVGDETV